MKATVGVKELYKLTPDYFDFFIKEIDAFLEKTTGSYSESILNNEEILFRNIMISVLLKEIHNQDQISEAEKTI